MSVVGWEDIRDRQWQLDVQVLEDEYQRGGSRLRAMVDDVVAAFSRLRAADRESPPNKLELLRAYVMHELPTLLKGIQIADRPYRCIFYPCYAKARETVAYPTDIVAFWPRFGLTTLSLVPFATAWLVLHREPASGSSYAKYARNSGLLICGASSALTSLAAPRSSRSCFTIRRDARASRRPRHIDMYPLQ